MIAMTIFIGGLRAAVGRVRDGRAYRASREFRFERRHVFSPSPIPSRLLAVPPVTLPFKPD
jgi:hypothetical protein